jgi:hypothetical protein
VEFRGRKRVRDEYRANTSALYGGLYPIQIRKSGNIIRQVEYKVVCRVSNQSAFDLARITSLNPVSIAWELVPFSFVFDWFWDVGGYLSLQEAAWGRGLTFVRGYKTVTYVHDITALCVQDKTNVGSGYWSCYFKGSDYRAWKQRTVLGSFPRPSLPKLEVKLGVQRLLSAASLLRTVILGRV